MKRFIFGCFIVACSFHFWGCSGILTPSTTTTTVPGQPAYTVVYNGNGNTGGSVPIDGNTYTYNQVFAVIGNTGNLTKIGGVFSGWNTKADGAGIDRVPGAFFAMGSANVILYAKWTPTYTVTYDGNGNTGGNVPTDSTTYLENVTVTVLGNGTLERTGYSFTGWNTLANGTGTNRAATSTFTMSSSNVTLYAKWSPTYTITYDGNGNTAGSIPTDSIKYLAGATVTVLGYGSLTKTGYEFMGWNTEANGTGTNRVPGAAFTMGTSDVTIFAKWKNYFVIGDTGPAGGQVFYDKGFYSSGWRYMEVAANDQSTGIVWSNITATLIGAAAQGTAIGTGEANTTAIVTQSGCTSGAAYNCDNLVLGGYDDWFLPSKDEMDIMFANLNGTGLGGFTSPWYWCSTEQFFSSAYVRGCSPNKDSWGSNLKFCSYAVRAVRAF
jgi:uncharacterized repeat protein (TIGR02543 family)